MGVRSPRLLALFCGLLAGCSLSTPDGEPVGRVGEALGEPTNGFPTPDERLMIMAINRGRSDPSTVKGATSKIYPAVAPVVWHYDLSRSSRFHAKNLQNAGVTLMHTSPCKLNTDVGTSGCDGTVACACATAVPTTCSSCMSEPAVNTCGTDTFTRIGYFTPISTGEVAAAGYADTFTTVASWLDEASGNDGHRMNLLDQGITSNAMGAGHAGASNCWSTFDVSDSGFVSGLTLPKLPTASVQPVTGAAGSTFTFYATWADAVGGAPRSLTVVVDGACFAMSQELGTPTLNSTWRYARTLTAGCHSYYYMGIDASGAPVSYPTTGALEVGVGSACAADFLASAPPASCASPDGGSTDAGAADASGASDAGALDATAASDAAGAPDATASSDAASVSDAAMFSSMDSALETSDSYDSSASTTGLDAEPTDDASPASGPDAGSDRGAPASGGSDASGSPADESPVAASSGCSCRSAPTGPTPLGGVPLVLAVVALARRRSRSLARCVMQS